MTPLIYAACDQKYYDQHAKAFIASAELNGHEPMIDLLPAGKSRGYYTCERFLRLPELLTKYDSILTVDIDSVFNSPIEFEEKYEIGLFLRPWISDRKPFLKVLCSAVYFRASAIPFVKAVREKIIHSGVEWYCDQLAMWRIYQKMGDNFRVLKLDKRFMNYDFGSNAPIWTAKGIYRKTDPVYLARKQSYEMAHVYQ